MGLSNPFRSRLTRTRGARFGGGGRGGGGRGGGRGGGGRGGGSRGGGSRGGGRGGARGGRGGHAKGGSSHRTGGGASRGKGRAFAGGRTKTPSSAGSKKKGGGWSMKGTNVQKQFNLGKSGKWTGTVGTNLLHPIKGAHGSIDRNFKNGKVGVHASAAKGVGVHGEYRGKKGQIQGEVNWRRPSFVPSSGSVGGSYKFKGGTKVSGKLSVGRRRRRK